MYTWVEKESLALWTWQLFLREWDNYIDRTEKMSYAQIKNEN